MKKFQVLIEVDELPHGFFTKEVTLKGNVIASAIDKGLTEDLERAEKYENLLVESGFTYDEIIERIKR